jgi:hypothetical protein
MYLPTPLFLSPQIADRDLSSLLVQMDDILAYPQLLPAGEGDSVEELVQRIMGNAQRYQGLFSEAVQQVGREGEREGGRKGGKEVQVCPSSLLD